MLGCCSEAVKGISQDFGARLYFVIYFYRFNLFLFSVVFFDSYNESFSDPYSHGIIFVFLKEWLVKNFLINSCKFVNQVFVIFEFLEEGFFTSCLFGSNEFVIYVFLHNWLMKSFCQPQYFFFVCWHPLIVIMLSSE